ncbi:Uncharacterized protein APZ42_024142 [Daphnia magna]|uniref:Uncharacterized protein n=1 Tax=Daphnia magna TaxID=35525 RepID=A0A164UGR1_9CRUS|nr:Uncharacterized protein APZ42_024142 [Daphnia magna]
MNKSCIFTKFYRYLVLTDAELTVFNTLCILNRPKTWENTPFFILMFLIGFHSLAIHAN